MNTAKIYHDINGNERTIHQMVTEDPHWAANRIQAGEKAIEQLESIGSDMAILPKELTAENGAKYLMSGEFSVTYQVFNPDYCGCGECDFCKEYHGEPESVEQRSAITWTTIKEIYKKIVDHYTE